MNSVVPNHEFMELRTMHQVPCKQQCFVYTDIDLPPEITKFSEKIKNGNVPTYKKEHSSPPPVVHRGKSRKVVAVFGGLFVFIALAIGIPIALQLRSSSLLEARLAFIRRLLSENPPLVEGHWRPQLGGNFTSSVADITQNMVGALVWPVAVPCGAQYLDGVQLALEGIDEAKRLVRTNPMLKVIELADEIEETHAEGKIGVLLGLQAGHALGSSLAVLRSMHSLGVRVISITGLGCTTPWAAATIKSDMIVLDDSQPHSLTTFGETVLHEMNRLGILVEISRLSEPAMMMALHTARAPVLFSNAAPLSLCNSSSTAGVPDHILGMLTQNGGVLMINVERCGEKQLSVREAISTINYVRAVAGVDHVGLSGSPGTYPPLLAELARDRLWGNAAIKKLVGGNFVRVLREVEVLRNRQPLHEEWIPNAAIEGNSYCRYSET
ncbi:dipeptidase 3 [Phlebotomus argentipes]|uniref:dipeptidase 3 n=1 Tax=Phlebotomus argentipes TaxID=94469 RepID=UPI002893178A|nr:dipeptidase 3 [Phlebotomus argentipes]